MCSGGCFILKGWCGFYVLAFNGNIFFGFKKEDVSAKLENGYLTITAAKGLDKDEKNDKGVYIRRERYSGQCARTFYVGEAVTQEDIKAKFEDGILKVTIPKVEPKKVEDKKYIAIEG